MQVFVIRSYIQWKRTGQTPFVFSKSESPHDYVGLVFKIMTVVSLFVVISFTFFDDFYQRYMGVLEYLNHVELQWIGTGVLIASLSWTIIAQYQMANSWRIGIDYEEKTTLVNKGVFSLSRNPVFVGVMMVYTGTFLIAPNAITLMLEVLCFFMLQIQARLEEEYLERIHGEEYVTYKNKVRRWL